MHDSTIRKQVYDLTASDLARFPVWEFALDEEGVEGQDEATVRPRPGAQEVDPDEGTFVVKTEFLARDGSRFEGYLTVSGLQKHDLGLAQPVIVAGPAQVAFWFGIVKPTRAELATAYRALGKTANELFPVTFKAVIPIRGATLPRQIPAFLYLTEGERVTPIR